MKIDEENRQIKFYLDQATKMPVTTKIFSQLIFKQPIVLKELKIQILIKKTENLHEINFGLMENKDFRMLGQNVIYQNSSMVAFKQLCFFS